MKITAYKCDRCSEIITDKGFVIHGPIDYISDGEMIGRMMVGPVEEHLCFDCLIHKMDYPSEYISTDDGLTK